MDASGLVSNKRQRIQTLKGKEKMEETTIGEEAVCGICLSSGGLAVRGRIDSCDHYFCFICIAEWAKVESRCPMCKQRFRFICRPDASGILTSESVLEIPARDQVYHPLGNESSALSDPYAEINCRVCRHSNDDELLLLCDLCDSAFHTYCSGLGYTVPEGDWYCHDCTILKEEHEKIGDEHGKIDGDDDDDENQDKCTRVLDQQHSVSILDIVADESRSTIEPFSQQCFRDRSASRNSHLLQRNSEGIVIPVKESNIFALSRGADFSQREMAFRHSRNMQSRIQDFRKNWNALQSGSLSFSSTLDGNGDAMSGAKRRTNGTNSDLMLQLKSSTLVDGEKSTDSSSSSKLFVTSDLQDIDKAWKMMQKAKTQRSAIANSSSNSLKCDDSMSFSGAISASNGAVIPSLNLYKQISIKEGDEKPKSSIFHQKFRDKELLEHPQHKNRLPANSYIAMQANSLKDTKNFDGNVKKVSTFRLPSEHLETTSSFCNAGSKSFRVCCSGELPQDRDDNGRSSSKGHEISDNCAKAEIQTMVKLNLHQLSKGECLGPEKFKEIARAATHSVLAACGFEHSKSCARLFSNPICEHAGQLQKLHGSILMPGSCRDCFHSFIKHVVKSIYLEKSN